MLCGSKLALSASFLESKLTLSLSTGKAFRSEGEEEERPLLGSHLLLCSISVPSSLFQYAHGHVDFWEPRIFQSFYAVAVPYENGFDLLSSRFPRKAFRSFQFASQTLSTLALHFTESSNTLLLSSCSRPDGNGSSSDWNWVKSTLFRSAFLPFSNCLPGSTHFAPPLWPENRCEERRHTVKQ